MIEFNGLDLIIQHRIDGDRTHHALAVALGVPERRIALIDDVSDYPDPGAADVVCVFSSVGGDFTHLLSIQVERLMLPYDSSTQLVQQLCELLSTQCLVPYEDDLDPYFMWSVAPGSLPRKIALDPVALDEGRYVVAQRDLD